MGQQWSSILTSAQVRKYTQHFIFWRRAIAIPPLHARDMYIVSPNCDMARLPHAAAQWVRQFPLAPSLPNFLAELSAAPRPYKTHCPSKAHRPVYMAMLAWLMRGGWVTQLCTFAYVVVWPEIVYEVEYMLEAEELEEAKSQQRRGQEAGSVGSMSDAITASELASPSSPPGAAFFEDALPAGFDVSPLAGSIASGEGDSGSNDGLESSIATLRGLSMSVSSPHTQPLSCGDPTASTPMVPRSSSRAPATPLAVSTPAPPQQQRSAAETAAENARQARVADRKARALAERATAHARQAVPVQTAHPSVNGAPHLADITPHIILDAKKASGKESRYLSAIERRLRERAGWRAEGDAAPKSGAASADKERQGARGGGGGGGWTPLVSKGGPSPIQLAKRGMTAGSILGPGPKKDGTSASAAASRARAKNPSAAGAGTSTSASTNTAARERDWDDRVARAWPLFSKYFNGQSALERIALQEDMKRKDVWNLLTSMNEYLLTVRTW